VRLSHDIIAEVFSFPAGADQQVPHQPDGELKGEKTTTATTNCFIGKGVKKAGPTLGPGSSFFSKLKLHEEDTLRCIPSLSTVKQVTSVSLYRQHQGKKSNSKRNVICLKTLM
jgi:hypothetical protein